MSGDSSEEKTAPASQKKLRDARKKGQIAQSKDIVTAVAAVAAVAFIWARSGAARADLEQAMVLALEAPSRPFDVAVLQVSDALVRASAPLVLPLLGLSVVAVVLANLVANQGLLFALDPVKPKFDKLNPAQGFKNLFKPKALTEVLKSTVKALILLVITALVLLAAMRSIVLTPTCGLDCSLSVFQVALDPVIIAALLLFVVVGGLDILLQRAFFLKEMKMTKTEVKRENKDQHGDPHIKSAHRRHRREMANSPPQPMGPKAAVVFVFGPDVIVGLRWVSGHNLPPVVVCVGKGEGARALARTARDLGTPRQGDPELARSLAERIRPGRPITDDFYDAVARVLLKSGAVK